MNFSKFFCTNKLIRYQLIGKCSKNLFRVPCSQKFFKITRKLKKLIFQKRIKSIFFRVLTFIEKHGKTLQKKRVIFFYSNKCNFLKHSKLVKFNQITLLNVNDQNEKIIFCFKIFKFNPKLWILKAEKN